MAAFAPVLVSGGPVTSLPVASAGVTCTAGAANTYGAYAQLANAGLVTVDYRVVGVSLKSPSGAQVGKVQIVYDEAGTPVPVAEVDFEVASDAGIIPTIPIPLGARIIPAGETIGARIKSVAGGTTVDVGVSLMPA